MKSEGEDICRFCSSIEEEVMKAIEDYYQSFLKEMGEKVQLPNEKELTIPYFRRKIREGLRQGSKNLPSWWPSLCEALIRDIVEVILAGVEDDSVVEDIFSLVKDPAILNDPIAAAERIGQRRMREMKIEGLDLAYGEEIFTAEEVADAVVRREGIGMNVRRNLLVAAAVRVLPLVALANSTN